MVTLKVFWLGKDNCAGHSERKKQEVVNRRGGVKTILSRAAEDRTRWKGVFA